MSYSGGLLDSPRQTFALKYKIGVMGSRSPRILIEVIVKSSQTFVLSSSRCSALIDQLLPFIVWGLMGKCAILNDFVTFCCVLCLFLQIHSNINTRPGCVAHTLLPPARLPPPNLGPGGAQPPLHAPGLPMSSASRQQGSKALLRGTTRH